MIKQAFAAVAVLSLAACATPTRFEWGNYENSLYGYYKKPEMREEYRKSLIAAIATGENSKRLAPGLHAELGYLFLEDGNSTEALGHFEKEMAAFPESRAFLTGVVNRVKGGSGQQAAAPQVPSNAPSAQTSPTS